jgi:hypothetical protein
LLSFVGMFGIPLSPAYDISEHIRQLLLSSRALEVVLVATLQLGICDISLAGIIGQRLLVL